MSEGDLQPFPENKAAASPAAAKPPMFFDLDGRRATLREYLFETKNPLVLLIAIVLVKILRVRLPGGSSDDPTVDSLASFETTREHLPEVGRAQLLELLAEVEALGFVDPIVHVVDTPLQSTQHLLVTLRQPDQRTIARVHVRVWHFKHPPKVKPFVEYLTPLANGEFIWTESGTPDTCEPASVHWERRAKANAGELYMAHLGRLAVLAPAREHFLPTPDAASVRRALEAHHALVIAFHQERRFFTAVDAQTAASLARTAQDRFGESGTDDGAVLLQIDRQLNGRGSWQSSFVLFFVTLLAFIALGAKQWGWDFLALLLPVLLFHELGHYVAMRGFGYRNVKMFFLPLLGAAVSGRSFNVAAWKQVIVALAGPIPGILLALPIGLGGLLGHIPWLNQLALITLFVNGFNLLPIMPLDGGRVAHLLLFRRHPLVDVAFRAIAAVGLASIGLLLSDSLLLFFPIVLGISIPLAWRTGRVLLAMRKRYPQPVLVAAGVHQGVPPAMAHEIIAELKSRAKRPVPSRTLATQVLEVFEGLNTRSPSWGASLGLGAAHVVSFLVVVVAGATFITLGIRDHGGDGFAFFGRDRAEPPPHAIDATAISEHRGGAYDVTAKHDVVAGEFKTAQSAALAFAKLRETLAPDAAMCQAGPVVLIELAAEQAVARRVLFNRLEKEGGTAFVSNGGWIRFRFTAATADQQLADALAQEVGSGRAGMMLIPPWMTPDPRTVHERATQRLARHTQAVLEAARDEHYRATPRREDDAKQIVEAKRRGLDEEAARLERENMNRARRELAIAIDAAIAKQREELDFDFVELWKAQNVPVPVDDPATTQAAPSDDFEAQNAASQKRFVEMAKKLGTLTTDNEPPEQPYLQWWCEANARAEGAQIELNIEQRSPAMTLPTIVRWLDGKADDLRFGIRAEDYTPETAVRGASGGR